MSNAALKTNKHMVLAVTMVANFFNPFTGSAVNIALPQIASDLQLHAGLMSWVTMAYLLTAASFLVPMGKLGDRIGRKKMFLWGNFAFMAGSFGCALSGAAAWLIGFRLLQGVGGAMMISVSMAILMSVFEAGERGRVIGLNVASVYLGLSAAPVLGGILTQYLGWRSLFYINGSVSVLVALGLYLVIRDEWKTREQGPFDWKGVLWYIPSVLLLMYGLSNLPGWPSLLMSLAGAGGLLWFIRLEMKTALPVLDVRMFKQNLVYGLSNLSAFINYAATFAVSFMLSLYLQYVHLLTPRDAGLILMIQPAVMALVSVGAGRLSDKWSASALASIGMAISALGLFLLIFLGQQTTFVYILASLATLGLGFGLFSSPNTNVVMSSVDKSLYGVASATLATMRNLGMLFSMALASLAVHVFLGSRHMSADTTGEFLQASRLVFILFSAFCLLGVFTSMQRGRRIPVQ